MASSAASHHGWNLTSASSLLRRELPRPARAAMAGAGHQAEPLLGATAAAGAEGANTKGQEVEPEFLKVAWTNILQQMWRNKMDLKVYKIPPNT